MIKTAFMSKEQTLTAITVIQDTSIDVIIPSPIDIHRFTCSLPPLRLEHLEGAIRFLLRSQYPGDPSITAIDWNEEMARSRSFKKNGGNLPVYVTPRATLEQYRDVNLPLIPGSMIMDILAKTLNGYNVVLLISSHWFELGVYQDSHCLTYKSNIIADPHTIINTISEACKEKIPAISLITLDLSEIAKQELGGSIRSKGYSIHNVSIASCINKVSLPRASLFSEHTNIKKPWMLRFTLALVFLNIIGLSIFTDRIAHKQEELLASTREEYTTRKNILVKMKDIQTRYTGSIDEKKQATYHTDTYAILVELHRYLQGEWIQSLVISGKSFQITAEGGDAIKTLKLMQTSSLLTNLILHQATPSTYTGERFTISGEIYETDK